MSEHDQIPVSAPTFMTAHVQESAADEPMNPAAAKEAVVSEVSSWNGVTVGEHRFGGVEFRIGRRELGHLHSTFADLPFPKRIRDELIAAGRARPHHVLPDSGWITVPMRTAPEVTGVIELLRQNYERATNVDQ
jgi:Luciferase